MDLIHKPFTTKDLGGPWAILVGNFDGFHLGHQTLARRLLAQREHFGAKAALLTFEPHPKQVLQPEVPFYQIYPDQAKWRFMEEAGLDACLIAPFTHRFASLSPAEFLSRLFGYLTIKKILVGYDFNFGKGRSGSAEVMAAECEARGVEFEELGPIKEDGVTVSSTMIRRLLFEGDFDGAARFLGRPWAIEGRIEQGHQKGRELGFPTINLPSSILLPLKTGVYVAEVMIEGVCYKGVCNVGYKPTFEGEGLITEAFIFDFNQDAYGKWAQVFPKAFLRPEAKFESLNQLQGQIAKDVEKARVYWGL